MAYVEKHLKPLREGIRPVALVMQKRLFSGHDPALYREQFRTRRDHASRKKQKEEADRAIINATKLRAQRMLALDRLKEDFVGDKESLKLMIPDGVAQATGVVNAIAPAADEGQETEAKGKDSDLPIVADETAVEESPRTLESLTRSCYVCKRRFVDLHFFYDTMCPSCAGLNYQKRLQTCNLNDCLMASTSRVKIGYHIVLKLLQCGAKVIVTTRFPMNSLKRFSQLPEWEEIKDRLLIYGLDLRHLGSVEQFCEWMYETQPRLDIIINNACQTVRRPVAYYKHLISDEMAFLESPPPQIVAIDTYRSNCQRSLTSSTTVSLDRTESHASAAPAASSVQVVPESAPSAAGISSALASQIALIADDHNESTDLFPLDARDINGQQLDLRKTNTWVMKMEEIETGELAEVFAINAMSPFILNGKLKDLMTRIPEGDKYIVNVSAMEGKFYRHKTPNHPHTNMAKAALNMMTRTSAQDYAQSGIYMNAVDTGWINDENPLEKAFNIAQNNNFQTPIDEIDAAARVLDPVMSGVNHGTRIYGRFLKNFHDTEW